MAVATKTATQIEADWMAKATSSAIEAAKSVIGNGVGSRSTVSTLSELEWGWICSAAIFAWIKTKSQQAVAEGSGYDIPLRQMPGYFPSPWDAGAVESILPALGNINGVDWTKPVGEWSKDQIISFGWQIFELISKAVADREEGSVDTITRRLSQPEIERNLSAKNGGGYLSRRELDEDIPFEMEWRG